MAAVLFFCSTMFAQDIKLQKIWDFSVKAGEVVDGEDVIPGTVPSYMTAGAENERGLAFIDGKLYIPSRKDGLNRIAVVDAETGSFIKYIDIPVDITGPVGTAEVPAVYTLPINDLVATQSGNLVLANLAVGDVAGTKYFRVSVGTDDGAGNWTFVNKVNFQCPSGIRLGDGISVFGDLTEEGDGYVISADPATRTVYKFDFVAGELSASSPTLIGIKAIYPAPATFTTLGIAPRFQAYSEDYFFMDTQTSYPMMFDMEGNMIDSFTGTVKTNTSGICGMNLFTFKGVNYMAAPTSNHVATTAPKAAFELFQVPEAGLAEAISWGIFPALGLGNVTNASYVAPVVVDIQPNQVVIYAMSARNGICAYRMTDGWPTSVEPKKDASAIKMYPNPAKDYVNLTGEIVKVEIFALSGQKVKEVANETRIDLAGLRGTYILKAVDVKGNELREVLVVK
jgi:hypothetical protein